MKVESYKDLVVWQKSIDLVINIYELTNKFPASEKYGLSSQMQRASVSIASNIAEGHKRNHLHEFIQFLSIAYGSGAELETQIEICKRLSHLKDLNYNKIDGLLEEVMRMLNVLLSKLNTKRYSLQPKT